MKKIQWVSSTANNQWIQQDLPVMPESKDKLALSGERLQTIDGFGGCFNELGWIALSKIDEPARDSLMQALFDKDTGCGFHFCRMPIGANDYAAEWYSLNEQADDLAMTHFSIERDRSFLIPYIRLAKTIQPDIKLFASPWSPPIWMKTIKTYNNGRLRMEKEILDAYALYFKKFVETYQAEGIDIHQIHVQNEPYADQKFPSCLWSGEQFRVFIRDHLGPLFQKSGLETEIWFGTLNGPSLMRFNPNGAIQLDSYEEQIDKVLFDEEARQYIRGVGFQWAGQHVIQRTHDSFPELKLMQTENECGDGQNTWQYAQYVFSLMRHYLSNGVNSYIYWNMVLEPNGISTWGWHQNALVTIDSVANTISYNPEFYLMKHFSHFVQPGAVRLGTTGHWSGTGLAFENPNGDVVFVVSNAMAEERTITLSANGVVATAVLKPNSFNTFVVG